MATFDAAVAAFVGGATGLDALLATIAARRDDPPVRPWTAHRLAAACTSLSVGLLDPPRNLRRLTGQHRLWREVERAIEAGPHGAAEVDEGGVRAHMRVYLSAHPAGAAEAVAAQPPGGGGGGGGAGHTPQETAPAGRAAAGSPAA